MKKLFNTVLALACVLTLAFAFSSCSSDCPSHTDMDANGYCDVCSTPYTCPGHKDVNSDGMCDFCLASYSHETHFDENGDMKCDVCGVTFICVHEDSDADEYCDLCFASFTCPAHVDQDKDGACDKCKAPYTCPGHVDSDGDKSCDVCKAPYTCGSSGHSDSDEDGTCDVCKAPFLCDGHIDRGSDGRCDKCYGVFVCPEHSDGNGDGECDLCRAPYKAPADLRAEFEAAAKATKPETVIITVKTDYSDRGFLTSKYTITYNDDGSFEIKAELQRFNDTLEGDAILNLPEVIITCDENGNYSDGGEFIYNNPSATRPVVNFMKLKQGSFKTTSTLLEATVSAADSEAVFGTTYPYDVTLTVYKNETEITAFSLSYSNNLITCEYK